ncbi:hypothetical protein HDU76_002989, partial [Blyttiomyces sp. JEL0837]
MTATAPEIVCFQLGEISSYVGTHCWNARIAELQAVDKDESENVLFCKRSDPTRLPAPRMIMVNRKGSRRLPDDDADMDQEVTSWDGKVNRVMRMTPNRNQDAGKPAQIPENEISSWIDFNKAAYHTRSFAEVESSGFGEVNWSFSTYREGMEAWRRNPDF